MFEVGTFAYVLGGFKSKDFLPAKSSFPLPRLLSENLIPFLVILQIVPVWFHQLLVPPSVGGSDRLSSKFVAS